MCESIGNSFAIQLDNRISDLLPELPSSLCLNQILHDSWAYYKTQYIDQITGRPLAIVDDQDISLGSQGLALTYSESAAYVLQRAVLMNDRATFAKTYNWTKQNLQRKNIAEVYDWQERTWIPTPPALRDNLFAWRYVPNIQHTQRAGIIWLNPQNYLPDNVWRSGLESAPDSEQIIAFALLLAYQKWGDFAYLQDAKAILRDFWQKCVVHTPLAVEILASNIFAYPHQDATQLVRSDHTGRNRLRVQVQTTNPYTSGFGLTLNNIDLTNADSVHFSARQLSATGTIQLTLQDMQGHTIFSREFLSLNTTNQEYQLLLSAEDFVCGEWIDGTFQENPFTQFNKQAVRSLTVSVQETDYLIELGDITFSSERNYHILANDIGHRIENLSYYHPEFYPFFAKYDAEHDWAGLNVSTFNAYKNAASALFHDDQQNSYYGTGMLIPDWTYIQTDGSYTDIDIAEEYQQFDFISGWEAHRIYYNLSLNYYLYGKLLAQNLMLQDTYNFFRDILQSKGYLSSGYAINGQNVSAYGLNQESLATNSTYLALFMLNNDHYYANILAHKLLREYNNVGYFGSNPHDYYAQNWAWFGLWLYTTRAKNLRDLISGD